MQTPRGWNANAELRQQLGGAEHLERPLGIR